MAYSVTVSGRVTRVEVMLMAAVVADESMPKVHTEAAASPLPVEAAVVFRVSVQVTAGAAEVVTEEEESLLLDRLLLLLPPPPSVILLLLLIVFFPFPVAGAAVASSIEKM